VRPLIPRCKRNASYRFKSCPDYNTGVVEANSGYPQLIEDMRA